MASSIKSTPTENWDDDFLFQLTPSRPIPSRSRTTGPPTTSPSRTTSSAFGTYGRAATSRPLPSGSSSRGMRESGSVDSDLDAFFSDEDDTVGGPRSKEVESLSPGMPSSRSWKQDDDELVENWDEELRLTSPGPRSVTALGTSTILRESPFLEIPSSPGSGLGKGYKKNASQSDLHERAGSSEVQSDQTREKKKEFRKSYHGQSGSASFTPDRGDDKTSGPIPPLPTMGLQGRSNPAGSVFPPPRQASSNGPMPPPTSYHRNIAINKENPKRPDGKQVKEGSGGKGTIMERVVSLHKRFSSTSTSSSRSDLNAIANEVNGVNGRPPGLKVDTSTAGPMTRIPSSRSGRIVSPALTPQLNPSESTRSIHSLLSSSSSASANPNARLVPDGLPTSSEQSRTGSTHTTSPSLVSAGFHLPSPSPASPYYQSQARFQSPEPEERGGEAGEEALDGDEDDKEKTPRRAAVVRASMEVVDADRQVSGSSQRSGGTAGTVGTAQTVYMMDERERDAMGMERDEERMKGFKMGGYQPDQVSVLQRMGSGDRVLSPAGLPLPVEKKRKSTLKRLSSIGKRHGRKVSDGWRLVSGSSANSNSTTATTTMFERKSSDSQYVSTPKTAPVSFRQQQMDRISPLRTSGGLGPPFSLAAPLPTNFAPSSVRSMKQTPSSTSSRISSDPQAVIRASNLAERNDGQQRSPSGSGMRRVSLSDLKIPSRVASAQKGVKEGMLNAKQFHESIKELKVLVARRAVLEAEMAQKRASSRNTPCPIVIERNLEAHWELAMLLIALGDTGVEDDEQTIKRERRITLASDRNSPPAPLSPTETPIDRPSRSDSNSNLMLPISASEPVRPEWTGTERTTKRPELTGRQLELLRGILDSAAGGKFEPTPSMIPKRPSEPVRAIHRPTPPDRDFTSGRSSIKENLPVRSGLTLPDLDNVGLRPQAPPNPNKLAKRSSSRSGFFNLRDMWRTSSNPGQPTFPPPRSPPILPDSDAPGRSSQRPGPATLPPPHSGAGSISTPPTPSSTRTRTSKPPSSSSSGTRPGLTGMFSRRSSMSSGLTFSRDKVPSSDVGLAPTPTQTLTRTEGMSRRSGDDEGKKETKRKKGEKRKSGGRGGVAEGLPPPPPLPPLPQGTPRAHQTSSSGEDAGSRPGRGTRSSVSSSTMSSDWDRSSSSESGGGARAREVEARVEVEVDKDRTIGRSDSRRMLASLGVRPEGGSPRSWSKGVSSSSVSQTMMMRPGEEVDGPTRDPSGLGRSVTGGMSKTTMTTSHHHQHPVMILAPENLGPLLSTAKGVVEKCRESLRVLEV